MNHAAPIEGLRSRKKREMREKLVISARTLFSRHGFEHTTIEAIANLANVSKPTVFNYFASKSALLHELVERADKGFVHVIEQILEQDMDTAQRLERFLLSLAEIMNRNPALTRVLMVEAIKSTDEGGAATSHRFGRTEKALIRMLRDGSRRGEVREDYSAQLLAQLIMGAYTNILLHWLANPDFNVKLRLRQSARFLGDAILPDERP